MKRRLTDERSEEGMTLIEVLIATMLMGLVIVGIVGGLATVLIGSSVHRQQADANTVLVSATELVRSPDFARVASCVAADVKAAYETQARTAALPSGWTSSAITVQDVQFQNGAPPVSFGTTCNTTTMPLQLVTIQVSSPSGRATPTQTFVKGDN